MFGRRRHNGHEGWCAVYVTAPREEAVGPASDQLKRLVPRTYLAAMVSKAGPAVAR